MAPFRFRITQHRGITGTRVIALVGSLLITALFVTTPYVLGATPTAEIASDSSVSCTVAPRSLPLPTGIATPIGSAAQVPSLASNRNVVDEEIQQAITQTVLQSIACANSGEFLRGLALYTDQFLINQLAGPNGITQENIGMLAATPPVQVTSDNELHLITIDPLNILDDGRIGAQVTTSNRDGNFTDYLVFTQVGDRWLIDEAISLQSPFGTPTP